jgi:hypothetical protein
VAKVIYLGNYNQIALFWHENVFLITQHALAPKSNTKSGATSSQSKRSSSVCDPNLARICAILLQHGGRCLKSEKNQWMICTYILPYETELQSPNKSWLLEFSAPTKVANLIQKSLR